VLTITRIRFARGAAQRQRDGQASLVRPGGHHPVYRLALPS
jgi:hypothetical protein